MPLILRGRYLPQRLLGQGGFGAAFYACDRDTPTLRPCVVKLFKPSSQLNPKQLQIAQNLFAREAEVLERLGNQHPQIPDLFAYFPIVVKSLTSGQDEEYFYLVQEFIDGEDLEHILERRGTLPEGAVKAIFVSMLKVLEFVHNNGAIHRDLKPSNIMKTVDNQLYLLDFGAVKEVTGAAATKSTGIYTTGYAPPEQVTGSQVFPASDLYSLAVTCIVLLTGKENTELFDSYSNRWVWQNHVTLQDNNLAGVLNRLLNASPQDRYRSAQEALNNVLIPDIKTPPSHIPRNNILRPWMFLLALLTALAMSGGWWINQKSLLSESQRPTIIPAQNFRDVDVPTGQFTYGGSTTWAPIRGVIDPQLQHVFPNLQLTYIAPHNQAAGSSTGIQMLIDGELDFVQTSRPLTSEEKRHAKQQDITLQEIPIAIEGVAVVTHPNLPISNISQSQLKDIYTGDIVNWQAIGGPNLPIVPISRNNVGGTVTFFNQTVLSGKTLANSVQRSANTTEALRLTASTPGAIYFASAPEVVSQCTVKPLSIDQQPPYQLPYVDLKNCPNQRNQPNLDSFASGTYPLTRLIYVVSTPDQPIGKAYAELLTSEEGQLALEVAGFARLTLD